ncbi:purine-nucleoside phosphorylase [Oligoflexia bacterium]|nr:purine-nucleoside phosphorylase [Oligoflexia bacterium]
MINYELLDEAKSYIQERWPGVTPACGLVLGSGLSAAVSSFEEEDALAYGEIPGLGAPGVAGHAGRLSLLKCGEQSLLAFQGRRHFYEGVGWTPIALPIYLLKELGAASVVLTNSSGSLREDLVPGTLMVIADHINCMGANPLIGDHNVTWGARFPDLSCVYDKALCAQLVQAGHALDQDLPEGVYLAVSGPCYETPAEVEMCRKLGADTVGMSTVPEAILAHAAGLKVAAITCITNYGAGISAEKLSHAEVTATASGAVDQMQLLLDRFFSRTGT